MYIHIYQTGLKYGLPLLSSVDAAVRYTYVYTFMYIYIYI